MIYILYSQFVQFTKNTNIQDYKPFFFLCTDPDYASIRNLDPLCSSRRKTLLLRLSIS